MVLILLGFTITIPFGFAQEYSQIVMGTVRNSSDYKPISFALITNQMQKTKVLADNDGQFIISFNKGDLLKITAIGFNDGFYIVADTSALVFDFPVQLKPRIYELNEFTITPYKTVLQFKHAVTQLDLPEENPAFNLRAPQIKHHLPDESGEIGAVSFTSPISALYNTFSHQGKMEKKYRKLLANDHNEKEVRKRFSRDLFSQIIPLEQESELDLFIEYCNFDFSFLLKASDYELIAAIQKKYDLYLKSKQN